MEWKRVFKEVAQQFADHKARIELDLQIHTSLGITTMNGKLSEMNSYFKLLNENPSVLFEVVFERMQTSKERDLAAIVKSREPGGVETALKNDKLLKEILAKANQTKTVEPLKQKGGSGKSKDDKEANRRTMNMSGTVTELRKEVDKNVEQVLAENTFFDKKFEMMWKMQKDESDRVVSTLLSGPHKAIHHPVSRTGILHP